MRMILRMLSLAALLYSAVQWYLRRRQRGHASVIAPYGRDTPTGTDPDAKWSGPGYEDKSLGQAVNQDTELVDRLVTESNGDLSAAEARFNAESAGAPALERQQQAPAERES
jgi:hypothetical protein